MKKIAIIFFMIISFVLNCDIVNLTADMDSLVGYWTLAKSDYRSFKFEDEHEVTQWINGTSGWNSITTTGADNLYAYDDSYGGVGYHSCHSNVIYLVRGFQYEMDGYLFVPPSEQNNVQLNIGASYEYYTNESDPRYFDFTIDWTSCTGYYYIYWTTEFSTIYLSQFTLSNFEFNLTSSPVIYGWIDFSGNKHYADPEYIAIYEEDQNGIADQAVSLNGEADFIVMCDIGYGKTFSMWVYPLSINVPIVTFDSDTANPTYLEISSGQLLLHQWLNYKIYVNGIETSTIEKEKWSNIVITGSSYETMDKLIVGKGDDGFFYGYVSDVIVYSDQKDSLEVQTIYHSGLNTARIYDAQSEFSTEVIIEDNEE